MTFGAPGWLWALFAIPLLALLFVAAERRGAKRLREFVSPRLLPQLGATVNRFRRTVRFGLLLLGLALAIAALAQPRWGYTYQDVTRRGLDLIVAIDTSRSMLANDIPPNRLQRVKLAVQDLLNELRGDRVGVIAFAGWAAVQAPLTIDYDAAAETVRELDTDTVPEGGSDLAGAITLANRLFGKSAIGNRALIIFSDGEETAGDAVKAAQAAADDGVRIFTIGVGTAEGSLIPLPASDGGTAFVKDRQGQVVKSRLEDARLREMAKVTGGLYLPLGHGPATMRQLFNEGLAQMQSGEIDTRTTRTPIERYQWPLGAAILVLLASMLIRERKASPRRRVITTPAREKALATTAVLLFSCAATFAAAPGVNEYREGRYAEALRRFQEKLQQHPQSRAEDRLHFGTGAAAYKLQDYNKALQAFSQSLLSKDPTLQALSHYNLGNTLYQRGEQQKSPEQKLRDWTDALRHYDHTLKLDPQHKEAQENSEFVRGKIEELQQQQEQQPTPTPTPQQKQDQQQQQQDQDKSQQQQQQQQQDQQQQDQSEQQQQEGEGQSQQPQPGQSPSPSPQPQQSPSPGEDQQQPGTTPSPSPGEQPEPSPSPGEDDQQQDGQGDAQGSPTPGPSPSPTPRPTGEVKGGGEETPDQQQQDQQEQQFAEGEAEQPEDQMSPQQAERLLRAMREEEKRVQLDERRRARRVYNDW
jgi:Ca-activated chloride channel homolog